MEIAGSRATVPAEAVAEASAPAAALAERRALRRLLLLVLVVCGAVLKAAVVPVPVGPHALDGSYYFQVARHVADGDGLQTSVSLYHQGLRELPHTSFAYPLWPLVLGGAASSVGLERAAVLLPSVFYVCSLVLLYSLANAIARSFASGGERVPGGGGILTVGHLAVLLFATNRIYFQHTSLPYSEGLAFTLAFAALLALARVDDGDAADGIPRASWAVLSGALAGLAFLARSQMIGLAVAIPLALLPWERPRGSGGGGGGRGSFAIALAPAVAAVLVSLPWAFSLWRLPAPALPGALFDVTTYRETPELAPFALAVAADGPLALLRDRAQGLLVAFSPSHPFSYARSFGMSVYLLPLAGLAWLAARRSLKTSPPAGRSGALPVAVVLTAVLCLIPVHLHHATHIWPWWFHWRHGLPMIFAIVVALAWLNARAPRVGRLPALVIIAWTLATAPLGLAGVAQEFRTRARGPHPDEVALLQWVAKQPQPPLLVATKPQVLAAFARGGHYHWIACSDPPSQLEVMFRSLHVDGVVVYPGEERCAWAAALAARGPANHRFGAISVWTRPPSGSPS
jgi:hypothetical protein